jgi:hypothetical protein
VNTFIDLLFIILSFITAVSTGLLLIELRDMTNH